MGFTEAAAAWFGANNHECKVGSQVVSLKLRELVWHVVDGQGFQKMDMTGTLSPAAVRAKFHDLQQQHSFVIYVLWRGLW